MRHRYGVPPIALCRQALKRTDRRVWALFSTTVGHSACAEMNVLLAAIRCECSARFAHLSDGDDRQLWVSCVHGDHGAFGEVARLCVRNKQRHRRGSSIGTVSDSTDSSTHAKPVDAAVGPLESISRMDGSRRDVATHAGAATGHVERVAHDEACIRFWRSQS
jgi:hypothetical protein